jgi:ABC-type transport system involved in multi-copper enzyme maturation permease subunit
MAAFLEIVRFECRYQLRSPLFGTVAAVFFLVHLATGLRAGINIGLQAVDASLLALNAAYSIIQNEAVLSVFGMFPALVFVAAAITRDHEHRTAESHFAAPITERALYFGRFVGGLLAALSVGIAGLAGTLAALSMPWLDPEQLGPFSLAPYTFSLVAIVLPNTLIVCALFYGAAALTRSMGVTFSALLVFLAAVLGLGLDPDLPEFTAVLEPTGVSAIIAETRYWTAAQLASDIPGGWVWVNRVVWVGVALTVLLVSGWAYRFRLDAPRFGVWFRVRRRSAPAPAIRVVRIEPSFGGASALRQLASHLRMDLRAVLLSIPFYVVLVLGIQGAIGHFYSDTFELFQDNRVVPVTSLMLGYFRFGMMQFALLIIVYYAGELVHRDRRLRAAEIVDASPFPDGLAVVSKVLALSFVVTALMLVVTCTFIALQAASGYMNFELGLYARGVFGVNALQYYMLCVLAVLIQLLSPNKWIGMLAVIAVLIASQVLRQLGFEHGLYAFSIPYVVHSDMNGYGDFATGVVSFTVYWVAFCTLLIVAGHLLYPRGLREKLSHWIDDARTRTNRSVVAVAAVSSLVFIGGGGWIFYNTNVLNDYVPTRELRAAQAEYERLYERYSAQIGPQATAVDLRVDIFPDQRQVESRGTARLVNIEGVATDGGESAIEEYPLFVNTELKVNVLSVTGAELVDSNAAQGFYLFRFVEPLGAGAETTVTWDFSWINEGFRHGAPNYKVVGNGTLLEPLDILPHGYDGDRELTDDNVRRRHSLPPVEPLPSPDDPQPPNFLRAALAAGTEVHIVVGTAADQIAVAPGRLLREWSENGRRYFEYEGGGAGEPPVWPALSIASARYAVARDSWNDVLLEIYHDPKHPYAVDTFFATAKRGLDYYSREFAPYQYGEYRMFEIPRYHTFARAFAGTIAYSEAVGFLGQLGAGQVDFATAHELAHQWWGAQVMGAEMGGTAMLNETLANYSALALIGQVEGAQAELRMLADLRDDYLSGRRFEPGDGGELPLVRADSLKGHLVLYALRDLLGAERIHLALRRFLERYSFLERFNSPAPPFPTSRDFIAEIRAVAGEEYQQLITDLYERVTYYDLRIVSARSRPVEGGFEVTIDVTARQLDATGGVETEVPLSAPFDIAVFSGSATGGQLDPLAEPLYLEKHLVVSGEQSFTIVVRAEPAFVGIDPYGKMIDRIMEDNTRAL